MSGFRIDQLQFDWNGSDYNISGVCNAGATSSHAVAGTYDAATKTISFDTGTYPDTDRFNFSCDNIDFSTYGAADMVTLEFGDPSVPAVQSKGGGQSHPKKYPPPPSGTPVNSGGTWPPHTGFSAQFRLNRSVFTRNGNTANFNVSVQLYYAGGANTYTVNGAEYVEDTSHPGNWVLALLLDEQQVSSGPVSLNFSFTHPVNESIDMNAVYPDGVALLVKETNRPWSDVDTKIGLFYILL